MIMNWHCVIGYSSFKSICPYNIFFLLLLIENAGKVMPEKTGTPCRSHNMFDDVQCEAIQSDVVIWKEH